jgi:O-antigen/teichoic acid export membrane protein
MAGSCGLTLILTGHQKTLMGISIFTGLLTAVAVYYTAGRFGTIGVASVVSASLFLKNVLMIIFNKRLTGIWAHAMLRLDSRTITDLLK